MSNDPDNNDPEEEPTHSLDCHAWELRMLAAAHLRSMANFIEQPRAVITEDATRHKLMRVEELLSIYEDMTRPPRRYPTDDDHPF